MTVAQFLHFKFASCDYDVNMYRVIALLTTCSYVMCFSYIHSVQKMESPIIIYVACGKDQMLACTVWRVCTCMFHGCNNNH